MNIQIEGKASITLVETREIISERLAVAARMVDEASCLPASDIEMRPIPENNLIFSNSFLEAVFLGDARANTFAQQEGAVEDRWVPEVLRAIRQTTGSMPPNRGYVNPREREGTYEDMMKHVFCADGTKPEVTTGRIYSARVALGEVVFIPSAREA